MNDAKLEETWGLMRGAVGGPWYADCYRAPLPVIGPHTTHRRHGLDVPHPPYVTATVEDGVIGFMLCDGNGWRASEGGNGPDSPYIYADGENLPVEWREPVESALAEVRTLWPNIPVLFRDNALA